MKNSRLSKKDDALIKSAIRRVFSRSELRKQVLEAAIVTHSDPKRKKVKRWFRCAVCDKLEAVSYAQIDHVLPICKVTETTESIGLEDFVSRVWCELSNLQALCKDPCHLAKSKQENKERRQYKKSLDISKKVK